MGNTPSVWMASTQNRIPRFLSSRPMVSMSIRHPLMKWQASNVAVKISGLGLRGRPWRVADNAPVVREVLATFGVERCMFASNYPVDGLVASYDTIMGGFKTIVADRPTAERRQLFHDNAARIYRIA